MTHGLCPQGSNVRARGERQVQLELELELTPFADT